MAVELIFFNTFKIKNQSSNSFLHLVRAWSFFFSNSTVLCPKGPYYLPLIMIRSRKYFSPKNGKAYTLGISLIFDEILLHCFPTNFKSPNKMVMFIFTHVAPIAHFWAFFTFFSSLPARTFQLEQNCWCTLFTPATLQLEFFSFFAG